MIGWAVDRRQSYFARSAEHRAADPLEFSRRVRVGLQVQADQRLSKDARAAARAAEPAANVVWLKGRARNAR